MKNFANWLFTTSNGIFLFLTWVIFYIIFIWQGFKTVKYLIQNEEPITAQLSFLFCLTCVSALCLLTANNYNLYRKK